MKWLMILLGLLAFTSCQSSESEPARSALTEGTAPAVEDEEEIPLSEVPTAALLAAEKEVPGIVFETAERETENGRLVYDLEGTLDGVRHEVEVTGDGEVLEVETGDEKEDDDGDDDDEDDEEEEEISLDDVPQAVKDAALAEVPGLVLSKAYRETEDGETVYELVGEADGERCEVEVTPSAEVLEVERGEDDDEDGDDDDD